MNVQSNGITSACRLDKASRLPSQVVAGYASLPASLRFGAQTKPGVLKARCLAGLLLLAAVLLPAAPADGQITAPTAVVIDGHSSGFVTGAGQVLTGSLTPANAPDGLTAVYRWYRSVDANGSGGSVVSSASNIYTTVNNDRGYRLGLGVRYRRISDDATSPETRTTAPVGVQPAQWIRGNFFVFGNTVMVGAEASMLPGVGHPEGFRQLVQIQRRRGSSGNSWATVAEARDGGAVRYTIIQGDVGYSFQFCATFEAIPPRVINSEPLCVPVDSGRLVPGVNVRLRVFLEGPLE